MVGIIFLGTGLWTLRSRPDDKAALSYGVLSASLAIVLGTWIDVWTTQRAVPIWLLAMGFSAAGFLHLAMVFPRENRLLARSPLIAWVPYVIGLLLAGVPILNLIGNANPGGLAATRQILVWYLMLSWAVFFGWLIFWRFTGKSPVEREQTRILILGNLVSLMPGAAYYLAQVQGLIRFEVPFLVAVFPLTALAFSLLYTILRYRAVNTSSLIGQAVVYSVLTIITGGDTPC